MAETSSFEHDGNDLSNQGAFSAKNVANDLLSASQPIVPPPGLTLLHTLTGNANGVRSVSWSPDGRWRLACCASDDTVRVWDTSTDRLLHTLESHTDWVHDVTWSPDGRWLASGSGDGAVRLWDSTTSKLLSILKGHTDAIFSIAWSPDGRRLASSSSDGTVRIWDPTTGKLLHILKGHTRVALEVSWSPDGKWLASCASDEIVRIWDSTTGKLLHSLKGHKDGNALVSWSPDGKWLVSCSRLIIWVWDPSTGELLHTLEGHTLVISSVAWSPDGKQLASCAYDGTVRVWDPMAGRLLHMLEGHAKPVNKVAWSPDGEWLASSSFPSRRFPLRDVRIWYSATWEPLVVIENLKNASLTWHPHLPLLVTAGKQEGDLCIWQMDLGFLFAQSTIPLLHVYISSAPEDEALLDELEKQLSMVKRQPHVCLWEKRLISPGAIWKQDITTYLQQAHLILFLVSPDFLASDLCHEEMKEAIKQKEARGTWVLPVLIRHTASWQETPVGTLEPLPADRKPLRDRIDREEAMQTTAERIQDIIRTIRRSLTQGLK